MMNDIEIFKESLMKEDMERVREYIEKNGMDVILDDLMKLIIYKMKLINYACEKGHIDIVKLFIKMKCNVECEDLEKMRPIHYACLKGHVDIVKLLILVKCDIECENERKERPIHCACWYGHIDIVKLLIENKCNIECENKWRKRPIHFACEKGHFDIVELLIERKCDMECKALMKERPIHLACQNGNIDIVKLLTGMKCDTECEDGLNKRPIHYACENGHIDILKLLIELTCNIRCEASVRERPIHFACEYGHIDIVKLLIEMECDMECEDDSKERPIHYACENGHIDIVKLLIEIKCDTECEDVENKRPIHYACEKGHISVVKLLIEIKCDTECEDDQKRRPIHYACEKGQIDVVKLLIEMECDMECEDIEKRRPIHYACQKGDIDVVKLLIEMECNMECEDVEKEIIADNMGLNCAKDCDHSFFCRESFLKYLDKENWIQENWIEVGKGSFGKVYIPKESRSHRSFVLKRMELDRDPEPLTEKWRMDQKFVSRNQKTNPMIVKNIEKYINICSDRLQHENIINFFGTIEKDNIFNIFMEYMEGGSLKDYINQKKKQRSSEWKYYCRKITDMTKQILQAVSFLHENRVIHRDIKPDNILLDRNQDKVKLSDFGVSRFCSYLWFSESSNGTSCGTPGYIAPEIRKNERYDFSADIWSVGATLYHLLTGKVPKPHVYNLVVPDKKIQEEELYRLMTKMVNEEPGKRRDAYQLLRETIFVEGLDPGSPNNDELN